MEAPPSTTPKQKRFQYPSSPPNSQPLIHSDSCSLQLEDLEDDEDFANVNEYDFSIAPSIARRVVSITPDTVVQTQEVVPNQPQQNRHSTTGRHPIRLDDHYERGQNLGVGAFALVFVGIHRASKQWYAIKRIDRSKMFWADRDALEDEINNLKLVRQGPHIMQLYEVYEELSICYLVTELLPGGELFHRILQKKTFTEREARDVCLCILRALEYMHQRRVTHRDLKPENLLLRVRQQLFKILGS